MLCIGYRLNHDAPALLRICLHAPYYITGVSHFDYASVGIDELAGLDNVYAACCRCRHFSRLDDQHRLPMLFLCGVNPAFYDVRALVHVPTSPPFYRVLVVSITLRNIQRDGIRRPRASVGSVGSVGICESQRESPHYYHASTLSLPDNTHGSHVGTYYCWSLPSV